MIRSKLHLILFVVVLAAYLAGCAATPAAGPTGEKATTGEITVYTGRTCTLPTPARTT